MDLTPNHGNEAGSLQAANEKITELAKRVMAMSDGVDISKPIKGCIRIVPAYVLLNDVKLHSGVEKTFTVAGANNIPAGALAVVVEAYYSSTSMTTFVELGPVGFWESDLRLDITDGNRYAEMLVGTPEEFINISGIIRLSSNGKLAVIAFMDNCTVTIIIYGYML